MPETPRQPATIDYAGTTPPNPRMSKLAICALLASFYGSPCLLVPLSNWINWFLPQQFNQVGKYGFLHFTIRTGLMVLASTLSIAACIRIRVANGELRGTSIAVGALLISCFWWILLGLTFFFVYLPGPWQQ